VHPQQEKRRAEEKRLTQSALFAPTLNEAEGNEKHMRPKSPLPHQISAPKKRTHSAREENDKTSAKKKKTRLRRVFP
jgi:hypothetical protein